MNKVKGTRSRPFVKMKTCPKEGGQSAGMPVEERFNTLVNQWRAERGLASSVSRLSMHQSYQQIIGMGDIAVPLLLRELEKTPDHWFWALHAITGANPVPKESSGNLPLMAKAWLKWGEENGYR